MILEDLTRENPYSAYVFGAWDCGAGGVGDRIQCGQQAMESTSSYQNIALVGENGGYEALEQRCREDLGAANIQEVYSHPTVDPSAKSPRCFRPANALCAAQQHNYAAKLRLTEGVLGVAELWAQASEVATLLANGALLDAFRESLLNTSEKEPLERFAAEARATSRPVWGFLLDPGLHDAVRELLQYPDTSAVFLGTRALSQFEKLVGAELDLSRQVLLDYADQGRPVAPVEVAYHEVLHAQVWLAVLADLKSLDISSEAIGVLDGGLNGAIDAAERAAAGHSRIIDDIGVPVEYYSSEQNGSALEQILENALKWEEDVIKAEDSAINQDLSYESAVSDLMVQVGLGTEQINTEIREICGELISGPADIRSCGETGVGVLADAEDAIRIARNEVTTAAENLRSGEEAVSIATTELALELEVRKDTLRFLDETNEEIDALEYERRAASAVSNFFSGFTSLMKAAVGSPAAGGIEAFNQAVGGITSGYSSEYTDKIAKLERMKQYKLVEQDRDSAEIHGWAKIELARSNLPVLGKSVRWGPIGA